MRQAPGAKLFPSAQRVFDGRRGNANFTVRIEVEKFDDYGARVKEPGGAFDASKDDLKQPVSDFLNGE